MNKQYKIDEIRQPEYGPLADSVFSDVLGYELFVRDGIRLKSLGIFDSKERAEQVANKHAKPQKAIFV